MVKNVEPARARTQCFPPTRRWRTRFPAPPSSAPLAGHRRAGAPSAGTVPAPERRGAPETRVSGRGRPAPPPLTAAAAAAAAGRGSGSRFRANLRGGESEARARRRGRLRSRLREQRAGRGRNGPGPIRGSRGDGVAEIPQTSCHFLLCKPHDPDPAGLETAGSRCGSLGCGHCSFHIPGDGSHGAQGLFCCGAGCRHGAGGHSGCPAGNVNWIWCLTAKK
ncbi:protein N-lysine methyltransferase METTL21A isoform X2 [Elephas maximus indicus]|uniref:protein N-lysine methyltransferase METTL21A isoform X2 n=1 Tax=Elephas maximus indicus TaxID=99487 RepID=UPI00211660DE|nr:protein N-lysine methyltransferase METTL21A isoform X2 [Elephas maximus indicus]